MYDGIFSFLEHGTYPSGDHKDQKRALRRKCVDYAVDSGVLYRKKDKERGKVEYLQVPRGVEEIERILHSCHSSKESEYMTAVHVYVYASGLGDRLCISLGLHAS